MKRSISIFSIFIVIFCFTVTAFSFEIDGVNDGTEWEDAQSALLFSDGESNNRVKFGSLMWTVEDGSLYLCFNFIEPELTDDKTNVGVIFSVDDSELYTVTAAEPAFYDSEKYRVEGVLSVNIAKGASCEVRIGFKHGIPDEINGKVRFIDSEDSYSNIYDFCIENETGNYYEDSYINDENNTAKTTKTTATKATTTKAAKTTKAKTTKAPKTTDKSDDDSFNLLGFLNRDETTEKESTKNTTKKKTSKTTKKAKKSVVTSVKIIEKEVYVTDEMQASENTAATDIIQYANPNQSAITTTEGKKYQMLTAIAGGIVLIAVAVLGTLGANKKAQRTMLAKAENESENNETDDVDTDELTDDAYIEEENEDN